MPRKTKTKATARRTPRHVYRTDGRRDPVLGCRVGRNAGEFLNEEKYFAPRGRVMKQAVAYKTERDSPIVRLEFILVAAGLAEFGDSETEVLRRRLARDRKA